MPEDPEQIIHLEDLLSTLRRRQRVLESQRARFGDGAVPAHILLELEDIERDLARHTAELRRLRPGPVDTDNPYLGLLTFQEQDAERFFGRNALVADLVERVGKASFLAVLGASGSGKSSVVRAGLIPMLKGGALPGSEHWRYITLRPGPRPLDALAVELTKLQGGDLGAVLALSQQLASSERALLLTAGLLLDRATNQRLVLVVDQAEELWTLAPSDPDAQATFIAEQQRPFIQLLLAAITAADTPLLILLTMRADFLHRAFEDSTLGKAITEHDVNVSPMTAAELRDAIMRPVELASGQFEPGLADELIEQTLGRVGALPLLEYTLQELWKRCEPDGTLSWEAYRALGGIEGALAARADAILAERYTPEQQEELRRLLLRLVQPGEGVADTRRRVPLDDLVPAGRSADVVQALLQPLTDERLLVVTTPAEEAIPQAASAHPLVVGRRSSVVEVSHEALIHAWPTFGRWIADARADLRFQLQLEAAAKEWQATGENADLLWSGLRLAQAEAWLVRAQPQLNARDQAFLDASRAQAEARTRAEDARQREREALLEARAAAERRNASRLRVFLVAVGVFLLISVGLTLYALNQQGVAQGAAVLAQRSAEQEAQARIAADQQARIAAAQANAGESLFELARGNADRALLLAQAAIITDIQPHSQLVLRDIRQSIQNTVPSVTLHGHAGGVSAVAWAPDGRHILTGSYDETARIWDAASGKVVHMLKGHTEGITAVAWAPDGKQVLTGSYDKTTKIWDVASGQLVRTLEGHTNLVLAVAWAPDGKQVLTGGWDNTALIWDVTSGQVVRTLEGHTGPINAVAWAPDGKQVLTGSEDQTARIWDAASGQVVYMLKGHTDRIAALAWASDGKQILTGSGDQTARIWDAASGQLVRTFKGHTTYINAVAWAPDGKQILTGSSDQTARIWDAASGQPVRTLEGHTSYILAVAWALGGKQVLTGSGDQTARIWDAASGQVVNTLEGHTGPVSAVAWAPDGKQILTGSGDRTARIWDVASGQLIHTLEGHSDYVTAVAWAPDSKQVLTGSFDKTARIWDAASGQLVRSLEDHSDYVSSVAWAPDGRQVLTGSGDGTARIWDAASGQLVRTLEGQIDKVTAVAWAPDGRQVLTGSNDQIAQIWDVASGQLVRTLQGHTDTVSAVAWAPDGKQVLTGSDDHTARIWDVASGQLVRTLEGHTTYISAVAWAPDGKQILTSSDDQTARIWDVASGHVVLTLEGHTSPIYAAAWAPNGKQVLTGSDDKTARIWIADDKPIIAELTRRVCNIFTEEQIKVTIPSWRGCTAELAEVAADLKEYDTLRPGQ